MRRTNRGPLACTFDVSIPMVDANTAVLELLREQILNPDAIEMALDTAIDQYAGGTETIEQDRAHVKAELEKVQAEITKGLGLVVKGLASEDEIGATLKPVSQSGNGRLSYRPGWNIWKDSRWFRRSTG